MRFTWIGSGILLGSILWGTYEILTGAKDTIDRAAISLKSCTRLVRTL